MSEAMTERLPKANTVLGPISSPSAEVPERQLPATFRLSEAVSVPVLPTRDLVLFPYMIAPLLISRSLSAAAVERADTSRGI